MVSPVISESFYAGGFIVREANGYRSRDTITLLSNGSTAVTLPAGTVLAKITASGKYVAYDNVGTDGSEIAAAILYGTVTVPATGDKVAVAVMRDCEVNGAELQYDASLSGGGLTTAKAAAAADVAAAGIIFR